MQSLIILKVCKATAGIKISNMLACLISSDFKTISKVENILFLGVKISENLFL